MFLEKLLCNFYGSLLFPNSNGNHIKQILYYWDALYEIKEWH